MKRHGAGKADTIAVQLRQTSGQPHGPTKGDIMPEQDFVSTIFDQAYALREEKKELHGRIAANRDIVRALYKSGQLSDAGEHEEPVTDKDGKPVVKDGVEQTKKVKDGGQMEEALELYPTLLGRSANGDGDSDGAGS